ncbi:hypothetical protein L7F22_031537 [Adiantum nelumboides]|nr:hypothetical protein [Adiantum nelumboides]
MEKLLVNGQDDRSTFDHAKARGRVIFFNSFVLVRKPPTTATLERAFASGYALMYRAENTLPGVDMIIPVWTSKGMTCIVVSVKNMKQSASLEKVCTDKVRSEFTKVEVQSGLICITIVMSLREPVTKDTDNWLLWVSRQEDAATDMDHYINLTCYRIDRNYSYLTENVKELLMAMLITVPNELADATDKKKKWIEGLLPEQYM